VPSDTPGTVIKQHNGARKADHQRHTTLRDSHAGTRRARRSDPDLPRQVHVDGEKVEIKEQPTNPVFSWHISRLLTLLPLHRIA
jgi:hypothetical protein